MIGKRENRWQMEWEKLVCERQHGMATNWQTAVEQETVGTGTRHVQRDGKGTGNNDGTGRELAVGSEKSRGFPFPFPFPFRTVLVPTTFSRPDLYHAYPW